MKDKIIKFIIETTLVLMVIISSVGLVIEVTTTGDIGIVLLIGYINLHLIRLYFSFIGDKK